MSHVSVYARDATSCCVAPDVVDGVRTARTQEREHAYEDEDEKEKGEGRDAEGQVEHHRDFGEEVDRRERQRGDRRPRREHAQS